jgi:glycosyltransferase involved in cell wall biosynthesis
MGVYASWVEQRLPAEARHGPRGREYAWLARLARLRGRLQPARLVPQRTVVVADFHPTPEMLFDRLGELPAALAIPFTPATPIPGVRYGFLRLDTNPFELGEEVSAETPHTIDAVASFLPWERLTGQTLRRWWQQGIRRCWFLRENQLVGIRPFWAMAFRGYSNTLGQSWGGEMAEPTCRAVLAATDATGVSVAPRRPQRIVHYTESLTSGGAERQMCNMALAQKRAGLDVRVLLAAPPTGKHGHYLPLLEQAGVPVAAAGAAWRVEFVNAWTTRVNRPEALGLLPRDLRDRAIDVAAELLLEPADVLHCWLDHPNVAGLVGARIAGTPAVLLSLRGLSPEQAPRLNTPWLRPWYKLAFELPGVGIVANSKAGARDYENWLGVKAGAIGVLRNAFVPPAAADAHAVAAFRKEFSISPNTPVLVGIFRLDPEKRPLYFLDLVERLRVRIPNLEVFHAGAGLLEERVRREIEARDLGGVVHLLGQRPDVGVLLLAGDVLALVSEMEGTPNAALEAQHFGCVPVLTDVGGARETVEPGVTGLLHRKDDLDGLADDIAGLFADPARRRQMAQAGRAWVSEQFDPERVLRQTLQVYEEILGQRSVSAAA